MLKLSGKSILSIASAIPNSESFIKFMVYIGAFMSLSEKIEATFETFEKAFWGSAEMVGIKNNGSTKANLLAEVLQQIKSE